MEISFMIASIRFLLLVLFSHFSMADYIKDDIDSDASISYVDVGIGLSSHVVDETEQGAISGLFKIAAGRQWYSFISAQIGLWYWGNNDNDTDVERSRERTKFESISVSLEMTVQIPFGHNNTAFQYGPYYRLGRHCWSAVLLGLVDPWYKEGCSNLHSIGFLFPISNRRYSDASFYLEATHSEFDEVSTNSIQIGSKVPF
jgi:hypothetical protein